MMIKNELIYELVARVLTLQLSTCLKMASPTFLRLYRY